MTSNLNPGIPKTAEEEKESMKRIFDLVPRRKRSLRTRLPSPPRNFPRRTRTDTHTRPPHDPPPKKTPQWLIRVMTKMNIVNDPKLIIEKPLDLDDIDPHQNRLLIPLNNVIRNDFLVCNELKILGDEDINNDGKMGVGAALVDQRTKIWNVVLKKWDVETDSGTIDSSLVLSGEWSDIVEGNGLLDEDNITLWSFRSRAGILHFALDFAGDSIDLTP